MKNAKMQPQGVPRRVAGPKEAAKPVYDVMAGPTIRTTPALDLKSMFTPGLGLGLGMTKR